MGGNEIESGHTGGRPDTASLCARLRVLGRRLASLRRGLDSRAVRRQARGGRPSLQRPTGLSAAGLGRFALVALGFAFGLYYVLTSPYRHDALWLAWAP